MANQFSPAASNTGSATPKPAGDARQGMLDEIGNKWNKFSKQDLSVLKNNDDVVAQVVAKYGIEKVAAQRDVDALMKGRAI